jgi:YD repeat-containing protein
MGSWSYSYNVLGELVSQTDAKAQTVTMAYDALGRMVSRTEPEGTTTWSYDTAANGIGKLAQANGPNGFERDRGQSKNSQEIGVQKMGQYPF